MCQIFLCLGSMETITTVTALDYSQGIGNVRTKTILHPPDPAGIREMCHENHEEVCQRSDKLQKSAKS